jgi:hypothetical protein
VGAFFIDEPDGKLALPLRGARGRGGRRDDAVRNVRVPLHRGRAGLTGRGRAAWELTPGKAGAAPRLAVSTMDAKRLQGFPACADTLREKPALILDLRGNPGGSDAPAIEWCQRFSGQDYYWQAQVMQDYSSNPANWSGDHCLGVPGKMLSWRSGEYEPASVPYAGRLCVLADKGVASSGETFLLLASQIHGAILLGENSAGCTAYGIVRALGPLTYSRISFHCGIARFVPDWVRPTREGVGLFPDYWLDEDPVAAARSILH